MDLILKNDLKVILKAFHQWGTYNGLLEGYPTTSSNQSTISEVINRAKEITNEDAYYLIQPKETLIERNRKPPFNKFFDRMIELRGKHMELPSIVCIAKLWYAQPIHKLNMNYSSMLLIWFQDKYCFPIDSEIQEFMREIEWDQYSRDY